MKRRNVFAALLASAGVAPAQLPSGVGCANPDPIWGCDRAVNNQCPVCGQMAEPYKRKTELEWYGHDTCLADNEGKFSFSRSNCRQPSPTKLIGPMEHLVRCRRCNAAFFQDAEEPKQ